MREQSHRAGEMLFKYELKVEELPGIAGYGRRVRAVQDFGIPYTKRDVKEGCLGGLVECDSWGVIYPVVSQDSWVDSNSIVLAGSLVDKSFIVNSTVGNKVEGGEYMFSSTYYRKSFIMNSTIMNTDIRGETIIDKLVAENLCVEDKHAVKKLLESSKEELDKAHKRLEHQKRRFEAHPDVPSYKDDIDGAQKIISKLERRYDMLKTINIFEIIYHNL